jgi:hypothetical protein
MRPSAVSLPAAVRWSSCSSSFWLAPLKELYPPWILRAPLPRLAASRFTRRRSWHSSVSSGSCLGCVLGPASQQSPVRPTRCRVHVTGRRIVALQDPGVVKRSPETCFPLPPKVADLIEAGATSEQIQQLGNLHGEKGSFCVRCLVWRGGDNVQPHHCSTCQRCVTHFDHHCGVFGRCIAGDGLRGNMGFFKVGP